jgi:hypothetical protein
LIRDRVGAFLQQSQFGQLSQPAKAIMSNIGCGWDVGNLANIGWNDTNHVLSSSSVICQKD